MDSSRSRNPTPLLPFSMCDFLDGKFLVSSWKVPHTADALVCLPMLSRSIEQNSKLETVAPAAPSAGCWTLPFEVKLLIFKLLGDKLKRQLMNKYSASHISI